MKIKKETVSISKQVLNAKKQQAELLRKLADLESQLKEEFDFLKGVIAFSAQKFSVKFKKESAAKVDRTSGMLTGPLFTSAEYPIPTDGRQMLFPVLQVDLRDVSTLAKEDIGDGLLQLWCDTLNLDGVIRVIPRDKLIQEDLTPFEFKVPEVCFGGGNFEGFPLPVWFNLDPAGDSIDVMDEFAPGNFESQLQGYDGDLGRYLNYVIGNDLRKDLVRFGNISEEKMSSNLSIFGTYSPIQYNSSDTNSFCLLSIAGWGSSGSAQIFYKLSPDGETKFSFFSSVR